MCTGPHAFIPADQTARAELVFSQFGQRMENVFYFTNEDQWDSAALTTLAESIITSWTDNIKPLQSNTVSFLKVVATDVSAEGAAGVEVSAGSALGGNSATEPAPANVTATTKFSSGLTGRSNRGRVYVIGLTMGNIVGNLLDTGVAEGLTAAWEEFFNDIEDAMVGVHHAIVSYCHNNEWRGTAVVNRVLNYTTDPAIDSQRRRLNGRGT